MFIDSMFFDPMTDLAERRRLAADLLDKLTAERKAAKFAAQAAKARAWRILRARADRRMIMDEVQS
jgi:hypothetical protein